MIHFYILVVRLRGHDWLSIGSSLEEELLICRRLIRGLFLLGLQVLVEGAGGRDLSPLPANRDGLAVHF